MTGRLLDTLKNRILALNRSTDLVFLIFLLLILHVSLAVKLAGIIFIYILRRGLKFKAYAKKLPLFYLLMMLMLAIQFTFNCRLGLNYSLLASLAFVFWGVSFLVLCQIKKAIETEGTARIESALGYFFIFNAVVTGVNLLRIIIEIRSLNPYVFDGLNYKYFASTGDYLRGITFDLSTVNNIVNSLGIFFFLYRRKYMLSLLCFLVAMFTTSNVGNIILLFFFLYILFFDRSKWHKSVVLCYTGFLVLFVIKVSPSNLNYLNNKIADIFHLKKKIIEKHYEDHTEKDQLVYKYANRKHLKLESKTSNKSQIFDIIAQNEKETLKKKQAEDSLYIKEESKLRDKYVKIYNGYYGDTLTSLNQEYYNKYPGKLLSFIETVKAVKQNPATLAFGFGAGNFSSKLAFKATNIAISGKYVEKYAYLSPQFRDNHLKLTLRYYLKSISEHSMINFPNSVFNQLLGEYGILGLLLFFVFYVGFFLKRFKRLTYGRVLLPMCLAFLLTDYWFESLSMVIVFEVMMFIDLAGEGSAQKEAVEEK